MKEERLKILEMLQQGKITTDEAVKLLEAIGEETETQEKPEEDEEESHHRRRRRRRHMHMDFGNDMADLQDEIQDRIHDARETLRASMPRVKRVIREVMPEVNRIVREATSNIPDVSKIINEAMKTATGAFSEWTDNSDKYAEKCVRKHTETAEIEPGTRVALRTPNGHVTSEIWERSDIEIEATITVQGTEETAVKTFAEQIAIDMEKEPDVLRIQPRIPDRQQNGPIRSVCVDFILRHPPKIDLDVRTTHGNITLSEIEGTVVLQNNHGNSSLEGASGNVTIQQHHGNVAIAHIGQNLTLETHHGRFTFDDISGNANIQMHHGDLEGRAIGGNSEIGIRHGKLNLDQISGNTIIKVEHGPIEMDTIGGKAQISNSHGPIMVREIGGDFIAENSHGPIQAERVGGQAIVKTRRGSIQLSNVAGEVAAENHHGSILLNSITGRISVRTRGSVEIENPGADIMVQSQGGSIDIHPHLPISHTYAIQSKEGSVDITIPDGSTVDVQAFVNRGRLRTDLPLSITGSPGAGQAISGKLNGGGARIAIEVDRGSLDIHSGDVVESFEDDEPMPVPAPPVPPVAPVPPIPPAQ